jgi:hypothetical protein
MGGPNLPDRYELTAHVAQVFHGTGFVVDDAWLEWWPEARYVRLVVLQEDGATMDDETAGRLLAQYVYELRKRLIKYTGLTWVVVVYDAPIFVRKCKKILARVAQQFG